jgi:hypothetical protein
MAATPPRGGAGVGGMATAGQCATDVRGNGQLLIGVPVKFLAPPAGLEPAPPAPEAGALSAELRGRALPAPLRVAARAAERS